MIMQFDASDLVKQLTRELENFEEIAKYLIPQRGDLPRLRGIDVFGGTIPLNASHRGRKTRSSISWRT